MAYNIVGKCSPHYIVGKCFPHFMIVCIPSHTITGVTLANVQLVLREGSFLAKRKNRVRNCFLISQKE
jgi:hypothetical protein